MRYIKKTLFNDNIQIIMRANIILITVISIVISKCRTTTGNSGQCISFKNYVVTIKT